MKNRKFETNSKNDMENYIYGRNPLYSYLSGNHISKVYLQKGFSDNKILEALKKARLVPIYVDQAVLNKMTNNAVHQGVVAEVKPFNYSSVDEILYACKKKTNPLILILDEVSDPHNFGAIIRSCDAFDVDGIIIKSRNQVPVNMTVSKVSTGAIDFVKIAKVNNLVNTISTLKDNGFWIYAADGSGKDDYSKLKYDGPIALVLGSEGFGISRLVLENSDFIVKIPMYGHVNSLNVSVATGILLSRIRN